MPLLNDEDSEEKEQEAPPSPSLGQRLKALVWKSKAIDANTIESNEKVPGQISHIIFENSRIYFFFYYLQSFGLLCFYTIM